MEAERARRDIGKGAFFSLVVREQLAKRSFDAKRLKEVGRKEPGPNQPDPDGLWQTNELDIYRAVIGLEETLKLSRSDILRAFVSMHFSDNQMATAD